MWHRCAACARIQALSHIKAATYLAYNCRLSAWPWPLLRAKFPCSRSETHGYPSPSSSLAPSLTFHCSSESCPPSLLPFQMYGQHCPRPLPIERFVPCLQFCRSLITAPPFPAHSHASHCPSQSCPPLVTAVFFVLIYLRFDSF